MSTTNYDMSATATATIPSSEMSTLSSIYIPRVYANLSTEFVADTFESLNLGVVDRVEAVPRPGDKTTYMAFVYFASWNKENKAAAHLAQRINTPGGPQARIVYDDPWYWILLPNKSEKTSSKEKTDEEKFLEEFNRSNSGICAQEWELRQKREKAEKELMEDLEIDEALMEQELGSDEKLDILMDMVEDLQVRLLASEKKIEENEKKVERFQKELYDIRTILLTGEPANAGDYDYWSRRQAEAGVESGEQMSATVFEDMDYAPTPPKLVRQTADAYDLDMPPSPPKLVRQNACVGSDDAFAMRHWDNDNRSRYWSDDDSGDIESGMMTPPPPPPGPLVRQTAGWWPTAEELEHYEKTRPTPEEFAAKMTAEIAAFQKMKKDWETKTGKNSISTRQATTDELALYATTIRVDGMGLVYHSKEESKNFWCDP